ncbi:MAG: hypothetical protein M3273_07420 [Actinomycetota bacterium]|nr:hypothetical protein [Actinomycetota bacterium]
MPAPGVGARSAGTEIELVVRFPFAAGSTWNGTDVDFSGDFAYAGQMGPNGGVHVFDVGGRVPRKAGFFRCPGEQNDVAVVRPGILAVGYQTSTCGPVSAGIQLLDVRDPARIRPLGGIEIPDGTHTLTAYPGSDLLYSSPGGYWIEEDHETIVDVSNPRKPKIVAEFDPGPAVGCHDVTFHFSEDRKLAACAGESATQMWDVSDPLRPVVLGEIVNPSIHFHHLAAFTPDSTHLVIGDEAWLGDDLGMCGIPQNHPTGALWVYDVTNPALPVLVSHFGLQREGLSTTCTAHNFAFLPGTEKLAVAWYGGGMNVVDLADPAAPEEVAYYKAADSDYWSAFPYRGRIYANGREGLDVLELRRAR